MEPRIGQIVTVFRSRLSSTASDAYGTHAERISELARSMPATSSTRSSWRPMGSASRW
ncbi:hypothetical protein [Sporichthya sp.]|uniref:hypothetical protein n=1 Tax=Sporichthya sp. TaxID=65475 RepID=UPI0017D26A23|nr:hypothetical protein [Sporichthya sp.]MBA3742700.1 hypothetical protein [Sporichthya sp.]